MNRSGAKYEFNAIPWQYQGPNAWVFVSVPAAIALEIRDHLKHEEEGWGRLKASAEIGSSRWETAIWFDSKLQTYLLPLKAEIRKQEQVRIGDRINITIWV